MKNTINLYRRTDNDPLVSAELEISYSSLKSYWEQTSSLAEMDFPLSTSSYKGAILVTRNLTTKLYLIGEFSYLETESQNEFACELISHMPYILYNDDFQDRPPSTIPIPSEKPDNLSGWLDIYERLFVETKPSYSLFTTAKLDPRRKLAIISDVEITLNNTLAKAWKSFLLDRNKKIAVRLDVTDNNGKPELQIKIVENIGQKERFFEVVDRSKGFLWFYNFVRKLEFNPKISGNRKDTIYLLDEPGSYLHGAAQEKLCAKLKAISGKQGNVIFCTHSHHLLDSEQIPINNIMIVSKSPTKKISVTPLPQYSTSAEKRTALQPVFEALQMSADEFTEDNLPVLALEGIYDRYAVRLFLPKADKFRVLAGASADSILKNIQLLNAFGRIYIAIWDNDSEGRSVKKGLKPRLDLMKPTASITSNSPGRQRQDYGTYV